ncbi:MAG: hypothetical protein WCQ49_01385 [Candidatus Saccharibacteria bacterium]
MDKKIKDHQIYMELKLDKLEALFEDDKSQDEKLQLARKAEILHRYHVEKVTNFQHERLIHLIVTFFFAGLMLLSLLGLSWALSVSELYSLVVILTGVLSLILLTTEIFYIKHYYDLENGVQKLYLLSDRLYKLK